MAALSQFAWAQLFSREQLLSKLLSHVAGLQPSDEHFATHMDKLLHQMQNHRFLDPDPAAIEADYVSFEERFASHALLAKSRWLRDLRARLLQLNLGATSTQLDFEHRVLSLLLALARNPLHTPYHPPPTKQPLGRLALSPVKEPLPEPDRLSVSDWGEDAWGSSERSLSEWESESCSDVSSPPPCGPTPGKLGARKWPGLRFEDAATQHLARCRLQLPLPTAPEEAGTLCWCPAPAAAQGPLFGLLRSVCSDAGALPDPAGCVAEHVLARQVVWMLLGEVAPGACLHFQSDMQRFAAAPDLHVPTLSPTLLANVLQPLMGYGAVAVRLRRFLELVEDGRNTVATIQGRMLCMIQGSPGLELTLLELRLRLERELQQLAVLYNILEATLPNGRVSAADGSAHLLTTLHDILRSMACGGGPYGQEHGAVALQLFMCSVRPLLDTLTTWLRQGTLHDPVGHVFITADASVCVDSDTFWSSAFTERLAHGGEGPAAPLFLLPLVERVINAGKAMILLRNEGVGAPMADASPDLWHQSWALLQHRLSDARFGRAPWDPPSPVGAVPVAALLRPAVDGDLGACMAAAGWGGRHTVLPHLPNLPDMATAQEACASEPGDDVPSAPSVADAAVAHAAVPQEAKHWAPAALKSLASQDPMHSKGTPIGGGAPTPQWAALQQRLRVADATDTAQGHGRVASRDLMDLTSAGLPCHDQFLAECVAQPILAWVDRIGKQLYDRLVSEWGLLRELRLLRNAFLMGAPVLHGFAHELFTRLTRGERLGSIPVSDLERMLRASLPACTEVHAAGDLPTLDHLAVELGPLPPGGLPGALDPRIKVPGGPCSVGELAQLRLGFRVTWPLSMLLEESVLQQYNAVTVFLMQILWAEHALDDLRRARWRASKEQASSPIDSLTMEMTHFVVTLHAFVSERMLHVAWTQLLQALSKASSFEEVVAAHRAYLHSLQSACFLLLDRTWRLLDAAVQSLLNLVLVYCQLQRAKMDPVQRTRRHTMRLVDEQLLTIGQEFRDKHRYLLKLLTARTLKVSVQNELQHLVMRLNFNGFYHGELDEVPS